uniref:Uncharacterized protein n=1 Tax=Parascaris equorum TaxID=6256 RepID=A0A914RRA9_PAREQ
MRAANAAVVAGNTVNRTDIKSPNESVNSSCFELQVELGRRRRGADRTRGELSISGLFCALEYRHLMEDLMEISGPDKHMKQVIRSQNAVLMEKASRLSTRRTDIRNESLRT